MSCCQRLLHAARALRRLDDFSLRYAYMLRHADTDFISFAIDYALMPGHHDDITH